MVIMLKNILDLTDDCLYLIFRTLHVKDQLALAEICDRFHDVIVDMIWRSRYAELRTDDFNTKFLTANEYEKFILLNASNVRSVTITDTRTWAFTSYLGRFYRPELMFYFTCEFRQLEKLDCQDETLHDEHIRLLAKKCPQLRTLNFRSSHVTGQYMLLFKKLQNLQMHDAALNVDYFGKLLERDLLKNLTLVQAPKTDLGIALHRMNNKSSLQNLQELRIAKNHIKSLTKELHKLPNLKLLEVCDWMELLCFESIDLIKNLDSHIRALHVQQLTSDEEIFLDLADIMQNVEELQLKCKRIFESTASFMVNSMRMTRFYLYMKELKLEELERLLKSLISKLQIQKQTLQTPRPILNVYVLEPAYGSSKQFLDAIEFILSDQNVLKCEMIRKKPETNDCSIYGQNYISFRLR